MTNLSFTSNFHQALHDAAMAEVADLSAALAQGAASDYADYQRRVGEIAGLYKAIELAEITAKKVLER